MALLQNIVGRYLKVKKIYYTYFVLSILILQTFKYNSNDFYCFFHTNTIATKM